MARTQIVANSWSNALADPAGATANNGGNYFLNDGNVVLRVVNTQSVANAVATLTLTGTTPAGNFTIYITDALGVTYTNTVTLTSNAVTTTVLNAQVLAATNSSGVALSTTYPNATATVNQALNTSQTATITFGGTAGLNNGGLGNTPVIVTVNGSGLTGTSPVISCSMTTPGTGIHVVTIEIPQPLSGVYYGGGTQGASIAYTKYLCPGSSSGTTTWLGTFPPGLYNQGSTSQVYVDYDLYSAFTITAFHAGPGTG